MSTTRNPHDFCVICSNPFQLDNNGKKLVVHKVVCGFPVLQEGSRDKFYTSKKCHSIKNILSTIYNVGSLWTAGEDDIGACPECGTLLTSLFIFHEKVNQLLTEQSLLFQMMRVMKQITEQITGPKQKYYLNQNITGQSPMINKFNQTTVPTPVLHKWNPITIKSQQKLREIPPDRLCFRTVPKSRMLKILHEITEKSQTATTLSKIPEKSQTTTTFNKIPQKLEATAKANNIKKVPEKPEASKKLNRINVQSGSQNVSIIQWSSLVPIELDHDYLASSQYKKLIYDPSRVPSIMPMQKENNQKVNEKKSVTSASTSFTTQQNSKSVPKESSLTNVSSNEKKVDNRLQQEADDDHVDMSAPCHKAYDDEQDEIIIEKIIGPPPSSQPSSTTTAAAAPNNLTARKSSESTTAAPNENEDVEVKMEFLSCDTCQKTFIYEKNLKAHRKICRLHRTIIPPPLSASQLLFSSRPLKSSTQNEQQQQPQICSKTDLTKGKTPPALHMPTMQKQLDALATPGKSIVCSICRSKFGNTVDCIAHLTEAHFPFKCAKCDVYYSSSVSLQVHKTTTHDMEERRKRYIMGGNIVKKSAAFIQGMENMKMSTISGRIRTRRTVLNGRCSVCKEVFSTIESQNEHICPGPPVQQCEKCMKTFSKKSNLKKHYLTHEPKEKKPRKKRKPPPPNAIPSEMPEGADTQYNWTRREFKCPTCGKDMRNSLALSTHVKIHWPRCDQCRKRFRTSELLTSHTPVCPGLQRPHICTYGDPPCGCTFRKKNQLDEHVRLHHTKERPYMCHICGKAYARRQQCAFHIKRHQGLRPHACTVEGCGKTYVLGQSLVLHMNTHLGVKGFLCTTCGKEYAQKHALDMHMRTHTGDLPFACTSCPKRFPGRFLLTNHVKLSHSKQLLYKCTMCEKAFNTNGKLQKHLKVHVKCEICGAEFSHQRFYRRHMRTHDETADNDTSTSMKTKTKGKEKTKKKKERWTKFSEDSEVEWDLDADSEVEYVQEDSQDRRSSSSDQDDHDVHCSDDDDDDDNSKYINYVAKRYKLKKKS